MFTLIFLMISFLILAIYDIIGKKKIKTSVVIIFSLMTVGLFLYNINFQPLIYFQALNNINMIILTSSFLVLFFLLPIGGGDKIFLAPAFLLYPIWLMWSIILLAELMAILEFAIMGIFIRKQKLTIPFYPFLFISSVIIYFVISII